MSEGDHESWDDEMMMPESNEAPMPIVSFSRFCYFIYDLECTLIIIYFCSYQQLSYMPKDDSMQDQEKKGELNENHYQEFLTLFIFHLLFTIFSSSFNSFLLFIRE